MAANIDIYIQTTKCFSVFSSKPENLEKCFVLKLDLNCSYTSSLVHCAALKRKNCFVRSGDDEFEQQKLKSSLLCHIQLGDFENIDWDPVLKRKYTRQFQTQYFGASSYLIRKGLSRKAQLSIQLKKYICKHPASILSRSVPFTLVVETWNAFEEMKVTFPY